MTSQSDILPLPLRLHTGPRLIYSECASQEKPRFMHELAFSSLVDALRGIKQGASLGSRLRIAPNPHPFIEPTLLTSQSSSGFGEIVFIEAAAAVGKSTIAKYLSGTKNVPLLDLADVPVSTGSLKALILDVKVENPIEEFHAGRLPVIIDALDEGRLRSGEAGFESFLITTAEFLSEDRRVTDKPKLIVLGRHESTSLSRIGIEISSGAISTSQVQVGFFNEEGAWALIKAYANAEPDSAIQTHPEPANRLIATYFGAIESALGLDEGTLWKSEHGRTFAGYAPVLAALGSLLAKMDNFADVTSRLATTGAQEAWGVIETVLSEILIREQKKVSDKLTGQISTDVPKEAYDPNEQLTLLSQFAHGMPLTGSGRVKLTGSDDNKYREMVEMYIDEHPFIRSGAFGNDVLGSVVVSHAIIEDHLGDSGIETAANFSRQPFLWRSFAQRVDSSALIDASYVGYLLNSYWNDPLRRSDGRTKAASISAEESTIRVEEVLFTSIGPIKFYGQIRDCHIDVSSPVHLVGYGARGSSSVLFIRGEVTLICSEMAVEADAIRFDGTVWLEAGAVLASPRLSLHINKSLVGWGGGVAETYPWSAHTGTLAPPYEATDDDQLKALVEECALRFSSGAALTLHPDFTPGEDDPHMRWVRRRFPSLFPGLVSLLVKHGVASYRPIPAAGQGKIRVSINFDWSEFLGALDDAEGDGKLREIAKEARGLVL